MHWERDLPTWSLAEQSRRVALAPHRWHVQEAGAGPTVLLLPGAGASVHSWRALIPRLAERFHVVALDLPGQGFTQSPGYGRRSGLEAMAEDIATLARHEGWAPKAIIGHSAGAAIALRLAGPLGVGHVVGLNPALRNFEGVAGWLFPALAKVFAATPFTADLFAFGSSEARARRLIEGTGSKIDADGLGYYARLIGDRTHVDGALQMMARWSLDGLLEDLPSVTAKVLFLAAENDAAVPPYVATDAAALIPGAQLLPLPGLGHLAHEEDPERILNTIFEFLI